MKLYNIYNTICHDFGRVCNIYIYTLKFVLCLYQGVTKSQTRKNKVNTDNIMVLELKFIIIVHWFLP